MKREARNYIDNKLKPPKAFLTGVSTNSNLQMVQQKETILASNRKTAVLLNRS